MTTVHEDGYAPYIKCKRSFSQHVITVLGETPAKAPSNTWAIKNMRDNNECSSLFKVKSLESFVNIVLEK